MTKRTILAIDQGTSSTKCLLVDETGAIIARGISPVGERHPQPGWVEQDSDEIWRSIREAVQRCLEGQDHRAVLAIGFSTQRESLLMWERSSGRALSPIVSWQDQRTAADCDEIRTPQTEILVRQKSGLPLDPMFSALKAKWLLDCHDSARTRARAGEICLGTIDSWILSRFGGAHLIEAGNASRTQLLNVTQVAWDADLLALFNIPEACLPRIVGSTGPFPAVSGLAPIPDGVPILGVMGDSHAALFAHGAFVPGQIKATYGTGSSVMGLVHKPEALDPGLCLTIAWSIDGPVFAAEGNIRAAGATLRWVSELFAVSTDELVELAARSSSGDVFLVPGFNGLGAPWWDRKAVGLLAGFTLGTDRGAIARAALESIGHQVADVVEAIDRGVGRVQKVFADGGITRNSTLMQFQADLLLRPVLRSHTSELSALGAAHLAGHKLGIWSQSDLSALTRERDMFRCDMAPAQANEARERWHQAVARARGMPGGAAQQEKFSVVAGGRA